MWDTVRRELVRLQWDAEPPLTLDLMADWARTVQTLVAIRRALGPVPAHDPVALLATATTGAMRTPNLTFTEAPSLLGVNAALAGVGGDIEVRPDLDRQSEVAILNQVAYELAHWVRVRTPDDRAKAWLLAGETALDGAIHAPASRSAVGVGLVAWQDALADVQPIQNAAIVRRSVALGHLAILRNTHNLVGETRESGALPQPYADALLSSIRDLALAHQTALSQIDGRSLGSTRVDQAVMLRLGVAVRRVTDRPAASEPSHVCLDALLRSNIGQVVLVANLTDERRGHPAAARISRLSLEYLANPRMLRLADPPGTLTAPAPVEPKTAAVREPSASARITPVEPSISPGTVLDGPSILALCRARDLGVAAGTADPANPPDSLRGVDPSRWPQLVVQGRQAVTDLVASVIPMAYAQTRGVPHAPDVRGQMFVELMGAAHLFDPKRISPDRWPKYAWTTLEHSRWRGVDDAGVVRARSRPGRPRPATMALGEMEPVSREPGPDVGVEQRESIKAIAQAVEYLHPSLREPLLQSMQGHRAQAIAEDIGMSESTARRRIKEAREHLRDDLASNVDDRPWMPFDKGTDPVLERAQRLFEQAFAPSPDLGPNRGPAR